MGDRKEENYCIVEKRTDVQISFPVCTFLVWATCSCVILSHHRPAVGPAGIPS